MYMNLTKLKQLAGIVTESYDGPGFITNIEKQTKENANFRKVIFTAHNIQLVLMSIKPKSDIGMEVHEETDQFVRVEEGTGFAMLNGKKTIIKDGSSIVIPKGTEHNIVNTSDSKDLKLYTIYSPPHHKKDVVHRTKEDVSPEEWDGNTDVE